MKKYTAMAFTFLLGNEAWACDACRKLQPKLLAGITHGAGPDGPLDYYIVLLMVGVTLYTLFATVKCFIRTSETNTHHIKRSILNN
jgi:hypothetical protein